MTGDKAAANEAAKPGRVPQTTKGVAVSGDHVYKPGWLMPEPEGWDRQLTEADLEAEAKNAERERDPEPEA